jgi:hypothetical protein
MLKDITALNWDKAEKVFLFCWEALGSVLESFNPKLLPCQNIISLVIEAYYIKHEKTDTYAMCDNSTLILYTECSKSQHGLFCTKVLV